jgi:3-oxoacyl-[acyl-carrier protein] reductase
VSRVVVVTGAGQGIGRAFALRFAADGYRVAVADVNEAGARAVRDEIAGAGGTALAVHADVASEPDCDAMVARTLEAFGRLDVLINNAAYFSAIERAALWEIDPAEWDLVMAVNVRGCWLATKAALPALRESDNASVINMSSNTALSGRVGFLHYVTSKGAIIALTRAAARELGDEGIRVNCILPGSTVTEVTRASDDPDRARELAKQRAIKRPQTPADLVGTAAFLASDDARYITGQSFTVDGGTVMH